MTSPTPRLRGLSRSPAGMGRDQRAGEYVVEWQLFPMSPAGSPEAPSAEELGRS